MWGDVSLPTRETFLEIFYIDHKGTTSPYIPHIPPATGKASCSGDDHQWRVVSYEAQSQYVGYRCVRRVSLHSLW